MRYTIIDSDAADSLGGMDIDPNASDEAILEALVVAGYLQPPADCYEITDGDFLTDDGDRCVRDEFGDPVLLLSPDEPPAAEHVNGDDDEDDSTEE